MEGNIAEIIVYRNAHTATEKEKIESYLAIKYGITVSHDYLSGDGAMLWDSSALSVYHNNIAGIGRDNCQALYQKQSKSIIAGSIPAIYLGDQTGGLPATSFSNTATIANDKSFMLWGSNGAATTYTGTYPSNTFVDIMERTWLVQESGTVGTVTIVPDDADAQVLLVDADGDFTDGNSIEILLENGMTTYDFADGDYFTFGTLTCKETSTLVCDASVSVNLTAYVWGYQFGGFWTETTSSGVDLSDPTAVDFSSAAIGTYAFTYTGPAVECHTINVDKVVSIPAPTIDDILVCEGGSTTITIPPPAERREVVWEQNFNGNTGWRIRSRCRGSDVSDCYIDNSARFSLEDLQLDDVTDFSVWRRGYWSWVYSGPGRMQFGRLRDQEISLSTDSLYELKPRETMLFSGEAARWWGVMEPNDYVKFLYVVDGIETEFDSRNGNISTAFTASEGSYTNNSGSTQFVQMRVKVKNSWNEGHRIDNFKMTKILASPTYNFYDDAGLTTLLSSGLNYTSNTAAGTIDTIYVTRLENGCESSPDTVFIEVSPNSVTPMGGEMAYYCTGGGTVDLTAHISNYQAGGTWIDQDGTGVSLTNPTAVDVSALADSSYNFIYVLNGIAPCQGEEAVVTINIGLSPPAPEIDDIIGCEGLSTVISVPADPEEEEILYNQPFDGFNGGYNLLGRCTSDDITSCRRGNLAAIANRGLTLDTSAIDFSNWTRWATALYDANNLRFIRLKDEEIVLTTDSFVVLSGEVAHFSGDSRRYFGVMEATDYVKFFYVIDGVETEFDSRNGNISTAFSTSQASYENSTAAPVYVQLRVKVKCSFDEAYILDNFKISKTLNQPTYKFYDDGGLTTLLATGNSYDPGTTVGNTDIVYVTRYENACESLADTVTVTITPNDISPMTGDEYYYCGGTSTDLTSLVTTYVAGGTWTDLDTAGVTLGDGSAVDFSAVAGGTYNFLYTLTGSCADEEVIVTVHIGIMGASPYVVADNNVSTALTECVEGNWIYFIDPTDDSRRIAAINTNGNVIAPSAFTVTVDVDAPAVDLERASGTGATGKAVRLMRRQVQINCATCGTLSPAVDVRLYWEASEQTDAGTAMDVLMATNSITGTKYWEWFKVEHNVADIPANLTADGIENPGANAMVWSVADASGTESNSVEYVQFNGIANFSTFGGGWFVNQPDGTILPVEMLYLEAKPINNEYIQLDWATATEINNEGFELQRSTDGKEFSTIAWIDGHGNSQSVIAYNYNDKEVIALQTYYYRLKQVDFDGKTEYSKIVSSKLNDSNKTVFEVTLIPNPTKGTGKVSINTTSAENITFKVYSSIGKVVLEKALLLEKGLNQFDIHLENLATGTYNVILYGEKTKPVKLKWMVIK
ncbi:MAG: T9SS type A sorting domain-containing protein [Chitinophagales bacterium]